MTEPKLSLHRKLAQVMYEAERIPKNGQAPKEVGGYKFVQVGDAADYIRKALAEKVITMMPSKIEVVGQVDRPTKAGGLMTTLDLRVEWTLTDGESGETFTIESFGAGGDTGDKYSGKAISNAMKYALLAGFLLSTGDDVERGKDENAGPALTPAEVNARERAQLAAASRSAEVDGLIGTAITQGTQDGELRQTPDGWTMPFRVKNGAKSFIVLAEDKMAQALHLIWPTVVDQRVTVWGHWTDETIPAKGTKPQINYRILHLERIATPDVILPPAEPEPPDDVTLLDEAPTVAMGLL